MPTAPPVVEEPPITIFKPGQIIAWVGDQPIQVGDVMPMVEQIMAPHLAELDPKVVEQQKAQIDQQKDKLMKQALDSSIQTKLLYLDFLRTIPADKKKEMLPKITSRAEEQFFEKQLAGRDQEGQSRDAGGTRCQTARVRIVARTSEAELRRTGTWAIGAVAKGQLRAGNHAPGDAGLLLCSCPGLRTPGVRVGRN